MSNLLKSIAVSSSAILLVLLVSASAFAQVDPANPYQGPNRAGNIGTLPGATWLLPDSPVNQKSVNDVHDGVFSWAADLDLLNPGTTSETNWFNQIYPTPLGLYGFTAAPAFRPRLEDDALGFAKQRLNGLSAGTIGQVFDALAALPGSTVTTPSSRNDWFFGYLPERARWLKSRYVPTGQYFWMVEKKLTYADYLPFSDIRLQGARLYCAARTVQFVQGPNARSLGERVGFSISVLGQTIDFLVLEPTVALDGPAKFRTPPATGVQPDGAQAFAIPFQFGTRLTPIRGIGLPPLGEARVPVVLVTGDTEVRTGTNRRQIFEIGPGGLTSKVVYSNEYHTVTHADAIQSAGFYGNQKFHSDTTFPIFFIGPLEVAATLGLDYHVGEPSLVKDRLLQLPWPDVSRVGHLYTNPNGYAQYHDGAWLLTRKRTGPLTWQAVPDGATNPYWTDPWLTTSPTDLRAWMNDDHTFSTSTSLGLDVGLEATLGASAGPFEVTAKVHGDIGGTVKQHHVLRDALMAEGTPGFIPQMLPTQVVSVQPRQEAEVSFKGLSAGLHFHLDLPIVDDIDFDRTFFSVPAMTIADYDSADSWDSNDEAYMLRVGVGGASMLQPPTFSHLPGGSDFPSFVQSVPACLADPKEPPPLNPPCPPAPANGQPPKINVCVYGPSATLVEKLGSGVPSLPALPGNVCNLPSFGGWPSGPWFDGNPAVKECFASYLELLCEPKSWQGASVVSHVWNFDADYGQKLADVLNQCGEALKSNDSSIDLKGTLAEFVAVGPCKDDGTLIGETEVIQAVNPFQAPKPQPGAGTCSVGGPAQAQ
ncbi:MAG: hypothetical protein AB7I50_18045 [Vicinamibacterales bacterium]